MIFIFVLIRVLGGGAQTGFTRHVATNWPIVLPRLIVMMENLVERRLAGEAEVLGENLPQRHFGHRKSHLTRPRIEPEPPPRSQRQIA
jgi:hypothetical protein